MSVNDTYLWRWIDISVFTGLRIGPDDKCAYYMERYKGGYKKSRANDLINNYQKPIERKTSNPQEFAHKGPAILNFADDLCRIFDRSRDLSGTAIVPMPTSKSRSDRLYDDRNVQVASLVADRYDDLKMCDVFESDGELAPSKVGGTRSVDVLLQHIVFHGFAEEPNIAILIDDVFTTGAHYVACRRLIEQRYPAVEVIGLFWAKQINADYFLVEM